MAADSLYRITEGVSSPVAVTPGSGPAYPCGPPTINGLVDVGVFVWLDCPSGEWRMKAAAGGGNVTYQGNIKSTAAYTSVKTVSTTASDTVDSTTDPTNIAFNLVTQFSGTKGINFIPAAGTSACFKVDVPASVNVYVGPFRKPVTQPFDLRTQQSCSIP